MRLSIQMVFYKQIRFTWNDVTSLVSSVATMEAMWTKGPSLPSGIPEPSVAVRPTTFATSVLHKEGFYCGEIYDGHARPEWRDWSVWG